MLQEMKHGLEIRHKENLNGEVTVWLCNYDNGQEVLVKDFSIIMILTDSYKFSEKLANALECKIVRYVEKTTWKIKE